MQYMEEPTASLQDSLEFSGATGIPIALDETLDEALLSYSPANQTPSVPAVLQGLLGAKSGCEGLAALVVKPGVVGGFERAFQIAAWAQPRGLKVQTSGHLVAAPCVLKMGFNTSESCSTICSCGLIVTYESDAHPIGL